MGEEVSIYDTQGLPEWLAVLKAAGVRHYKDDDLDVEFFPPIQEPEALAATRALVAMATAAEQEAKGRASPGADPDVAVSTHGPARRYGPPPGPPTCLCGHPVTEHNAMGYCIHSCDPAKCEEGLQSKDAPEP